MKKLVLEYNKLGSEFENYVEEKSSLLSSDKESVSEQKKFVSEKCPNFVKESQEKRKETFRIT